MRAAVMLSLALMVMGRSAGAQIGVPTIVINEVMANALDEDTGEFVELFNWGDAPVDVLGWRLADAADTNDTVLDYTATHDWGMPGTAIPAGGCALIVDPEYAGEYGSFLRAHADCTKVVLLTIGLDTTVGNGLTNSGDLVLISDKSGFSASFRWISDAGQGISWEKIEARLGDDENNWVSSDHPQGSTPGMRNSVSPAPHDVRVLGQEIQFSPAHPWPGEKVEIRATIHNQGKSPASGIQVFFFQDIDADTLLDEGEQIGAAQLIEGPIPPQGSVFLRQSWLPSRSGFHLLGVWAAYFPDEDPADNWAAASIQVRFFPRTVVINEVMYDPAPRGEDSEKEPEWVEIRQRGEIPLDLAQWTVEDSRGEPCSVCDSAFVLQPGAWAVIAAGSAEDFRRAFPGMQQAVLFPSGGLPALNNDKDLVLLRDPAGTAVDSVLYYGDWGGGGGVSLERINPHLGSNDPLNWSWCVHARGATPGEENSIFTPVVPTEAALSISPNPFSPDGDGHQEVTIISYSLPSPAARITMRLFDVRGRGVRTLIDQERCSSAGEAIWDGRSDGGELLKMGIYIVFLEALDDRQGLVCREKGTVILAGRLD